MLTGFAISSRPSMSISLSAVKSLCFPQSSSELGKSMDLLLLLERSALHQHSWFKGVKHPPSGLICLLCRYTTKRQENLGGAAGRIPVVKIPAVF